MFEAESLDDFASVAVPRDEMRKQQRFLCCVGLLDQRTDHSGDVKTLLAIETGRQGIRDALEKVTNSHLPIEDIAEFHRKSISVRHSQYPDGGGIPPMKNCSVPPLMP